MNSKRHKVSTICGNFNLDETEYKRYIEACKKTELKKKEQ
jgi:hypothetical protein